MLFIAKNEKTSHSINVTLDEFVDKFNPPIGSFVQYDVQGINYFLAEMENIEKWKNQIESENPTIN